MDQLRELSENQTPGVASPEEPASVSKTAALLMDVKLQVRVLFGRTQIRLKDLLKLSSGSIVELDRRPDDAVECATSGQDRVCGRRTRPSADERLKQYPQARFCSHDGANDAEERRDDGKRTKRVDWNRCDERRAERRGRP